MKNSDEFRTLVMDCSAAARLVGRAEGFKDGYEYGLLKKPSSEYPCQLDVARVDMALVGDKYMTTSILILEQIAALADQPDLGALKKLLGCEEAGGDGGASGSGAVKGPTPDPTNTEDDQDQEETLDYGKFGEDQDQGDNEDDEEENISVD